MVELLVVPVVGMSQATLLGEGPLTESSIVEEQRKISPVDGRTPATSHGEPSFGIDNSPSVEDTMVHGPETTISAPYTDVDNLATLPNQPTFLGEGFFQVTP